MNNSNRTQKTKSIEDDWGGVHGYTLTLHPAEDGFNLLPRLTKILGPSLGTIIGAVNGLGEEGVADADIDGDALGRAIGTLATEIIAAGSATLLKEILAHATRVNDDGQEQKVAQHFGRIYQGNYGELAAAVAWVLAENFGPFFRKHLGGALSKLPAHFQVEFSS